MTELLTAAQMRAIERAAMDAGAVTGAALMERAGRGVVDAIFASWPELAPTAMPSFSGSSVQEWHPPTDPQRDDGPGRRVVVLCGPGNNGGDGFVVARVLREAGWAVEVFLYGDAEALPPDARENCARWQAMGEVRPLTADDLSGCHGDVIVDALFGTGLRRAVDLPLGRLGGSGRVVVVDLPTGLCSDSGRRLGEAVRADLTVTFHRCKLGHVLRDGPDACGRVVCVDIGLTGDAGDSVRLVRPPAGLRKGAGHKYDHGHALILSGGVGRGGAARMAARGALRTGAGAVTVGCPPAALIENAAQLTAVMLRGVKNADSLAEVLEDRRINALCLGPGLRTGARESGLVAQVLRSGRKVVLDADALTLVAQDTDLFGLLHGDCVLTPHAGEFARLFQDIAERLDAPATTGPAFSKVDATREAAQRAGCVVLFKGPDTVIADPEGRCRVNGAVYDRAAPWLATAGAGDVLAGFITGLLARGFAPRAAAEAGAWLHVECARAFGPGLIAEDLPDLLPGVFKALHA